MNKIQIYLFKKTIVPIILIIVSITLLLILLNSLTFIDLVLNRGFSVTILLKRIALNLPTTWIQIVPFALLFGWIFALNNLNHTSEMYIIKATGFSPWNISKVLIYLGLFVSILTALFVSYIVPIATLESLKVRQIITSSYNIQLIKPGQFVPLNRDTTFYVQRISGNTLQNIMISQDSLYQKMIVFAEKGYIDIQNNQVVILLDKVNIKENNNLVYLDKYIFSFNNEQKKNIKIETNAKRTLFLHTLINYKNLPEFQSLANNSAEKIKEEKNFIKEINTRLNNIFFPLIISLIVSYCFTTASFKRAGNIAPIIQSISYAVLWEIVTIFIINLNIPFAIISLCTINLLAIIILFLRIIRYTPLDK